MPNLTFSDKIMNKIFLPLIPKWIKPNHITWFRFITLPFVLYFFWMGDYQNGLILFFLSAFSDAVDGALSRSRGQVTEWGKTFDPLADKLLIGISVIILVSKFISPFLATAIVLIELFLIGGAYYRKHVKKVPIEAEVSGKIKMVLQSFGIIFVLLFALFSVPALLTIATYLLYLSIVFAIISLVVYKSI